MDVVASIVESTTTESFDTRTLVKRAADDLLVTGERPTVANVRARIGRGSATTINSALTEWWQELAARLASARARPDIPSPVLETADRLWVAALQHANDAFASHRQSADQKVADAQTTAKAALLAKDQAETELREVQERCQGLDALRVELERRVASEIEYRQAAEARIAEAQADGERRAAELRDRVRHLEELLSKEQSRYDSMEKRLSLQLHTAKTALSDAESRHREEAAAWRSEKSELMRDLHAAREHHVAIKGELSAVQGQMSELRESHLALKTERDRLLTQGASLEAAAAHARKTEEALQGELLALRSSVQLLEKDRQLLREQWESAQKALAEAQSETSASEA